MQDQRNYLRQAVNAAAPRPHRYVAIRDLAESLGWHPNYTIDDVTEHNEHCHLVVEHGLENAAVLTFLPLPYRPSDLSRSDLSRVLSISYNNLVDAHIILSDDQVLFANNRFDPPQQQVDILRADDLTFLSGFRAFKFLRPDRRPDFRNCEDELIGVVSQWRRILTGETGLGVDLRALSVLFNAIFFIRACEDYFSATTAETPPSLIERIGYRTSGPGDLPKVLRDAFDDYRLENGKNGIIDFDRMKIFRDVPVSLCRDFIKDFYRSKNGPYPFNFALMSKHALSRIYERYVTEMRYTEEIERQYSFLPSLPEEQFLSQEGVVYTPQFVASFFARYLIDEISPRVLRTMHAIDPACGSGIFLRTLLEAQTVSLPQRNSEHIKSLFSSVSGVDIDENAVEATRLSLSLLHLILTGKMPPRLNLIFDNAIDMASGPQSRRKLKKDLFIGNPPFIKLDKLPENVRTKYKEFLGEDFVGRADSYIAFLKLAVDNVRPGGFICFVLPHNFLITKNAEFLRRKISDDFHIHCLIDLSNVEVFKGVGAYVVLLIIQKKSPVNKYGPKVRVARIKTRVGEALQYCLDGTDIENEWYTCFHLPQEYFARTEWHILSPTDFSIEKKLSSLPRITQYMSVHQGFNTGNDDIFVRPWSHIAEKEREIYVTHIPDRVMRKYSVPRLLESAVFYPYKDGAPLRREELRDQYPDTWKYLKGHRKKLQKRRAALSGEKEWWRPDRPRIPKDLLQPKILTPHLCITPRFSVDLSGNLAPSRSPYFVVAKEFEPLEPSFLKLFCAFLNSSVARWYIAKYAFRYGRGYARLEVSNLRNFPIPDPQEIPAKISSQLLRLVDGCLTDEEHDSKFEEIDKLVCDLYGLTEGESESLRETF